MIVAGKSEGPDVGASLGGRGASPPTYPGTSSTANDSPLPGRLEWLVLTEALLRDPNVSPKTKLVLGAFAARPNRRPTRRIIAEAMPFVTHADFAVTLREIADTKLAFVDRSPCRHGNPIRLLRLAPRVDTRRPDARLVYVPAPALRKLSGRSAATDALLLALYHAEQRRRHGIQLADDLAARMLDWSRSKVTRARGRLLSAGILDEVAPAEGGRGVAIYALSEYLPGAEPIFDPQSPDRFNPRRTRFLRILDLGGDARLPLLANDGEAELVEMRLEEASDESRKRLRLLAAKIALDPRAFIAAGELLGGALA